MKKTVMILLAVLSVSFAGVSETVYLEKFDGDGSLPLIGTIPDVSKEDAAWAGLDQKAHWMCDGQIKSTEDQSSYVLLPFSPQPGNIYTLEVDVARVGSSHRFDFGFLSETVPFGASFTDTANLASPWMRMQSNGEVWAMVSKSGSAGQLSKVNAARTHTLQIVLDTTVEAWTVRWTLDGKFEQSHEYKKNPDIRYVGFGRFRLGTFHISRFELTTIAK